MASGSGNSSSSANNASNNNNNHTLNAMGRDWAMEALLDRDGTAQSDAYRAQRLVVRTLIVIMLCI